MAYTYHELKEKTVAELREIAKDIDHEAVKGYSQLNKEHLLVGMCKALNISTKEHKEVVGFDKAASKKQIKELKKKRDEIIKAGTGEGLAAIRGKIHRLKLEIRKALEKAK